MLILVHYYSGTGQNREKYGASACEATAGKVKQTRNPSALGSRSSGVPERQPLWRWPDAWRWRRGRTFLCCLFAGRSGSLAGEGPRLRKSWVSDRNHWKFLPQGTFSEAFGSISHASTGVFQCLESHFLFL